MTILEFPWLSHRSVSRSATAQAESVAGQPGLRCLAPCQERSWLLHGHRTDLKRITLEHPLVQEARNWDVLGTAEPRKGAKGEKQLDFSADGPADAAVALAPLAIGKSRVDADDDDYSSEEEDAEVWTCIHCWAHFVSVVDHRISPSLAETSFSCTVLLHRAETPAHGPFLRLAVSCLCYAVNLPAAAERLAL